MKAGQHRTQSKKAKAKRGRSKLARSAKRRKEYVCSKCGLRENFDEPDWLDAGLPVWKPPKSLDSCITICPKTGGPNGEVLGCPDTRQYRSRSVFDLNDRSVRACVPFMVLERKQGKGVRFGAVMDYEAVWRMLSLREWRQAQGPARTIDLQHLHDNTLSTDRLRVHKGGDRTWVLPFRGLSQRMDQWGRRIADLQRRNQKARAMKRWKLAQLLDPRWSEEDLWPHVVHVPIDLLAPINEQLSGASTTLGDIQRSLFELAEKPIPRRQVSTIWRDVYIYMLAESNDMSVAEICKEVFPRFEPTSRERNVRRILARFRSAVVARRIPEE